MGTLRSKHHLASKHPEELDGSLGLVNTTACKRERKKTHTHAGTESEKGADREHKIVSDE